MIYNAPGLASQVGEDPEKAPIPERHKAVFRFTRKFVQAPWTFSVEDIEALRTVGLDDADIVMWAQIAALQTWFTMNADGSGIPLEGHATAGPVLKRERTAYHGRAAYHPPGAAASRDDTHDSLAERNGDAAASAFVETAEHTSAFAETRDWARERYGFVPNLLAAVSREPGMLPRHRLALELLERPQSRSLSDELHTLARVRTIRLNHSDYADATARALMPDSERIGRLSAEKLDEQWSAPQRAVLALVTKLVRNSYKITGNEAAAFRAAGLDDEAYVDVLNTVAIQSSLDRLAAALGVRADPGPLLCAHSAASAG